MEFKDILKDLREEFRLKQKDLAAACNLSTTCISNLELGARSPTGSTLAVLADFFGCSIDYLMGRSEKNYDGLNFAPSSPSETLSKEEQELLEAFRKLNAKNKLHVKIYAQLRLEEQSSPTTYPRKA